MPVGCNVTEFVLVHSLLGRTRHIPLARRPLWGWAFRVSRKYGFDLPSS